MSRQETIEHYGRAWAQTDPIDIRAALERCWTVTSTYTDPITDPVRGIAGLVAAIVEFRIRFPGAAISPTSPLDTHHTVGRSSWLMTMPAPVLFDGVTYGVQTRGLDFLEFTHDDRVARVVGFFTPSP